jgi:hypothetical protein
VGYGGLGLIFWHAVEIDPRDISERKVRKVCLFASLSLSYSFGMLFSKQLMNLTPTSTHMAGIWGVKKMADPSTGDELVWQKTQSWR